MFKKDILKTHDMSNYIKYFAYLVVFTTVMSACHNEEVNEDEGPNFSEIHEDIQYNFDEVEISGLKYLILERDRNNPHEGFGFMALKGENNRRNQDSIKAYLKTMITLQNQILSKMNDMSFDELEQSSEELFLEYLPKISKPEVPEEKLDSLK